MEVTDIDDYAPACLMKRTLQITGTRTLYMYMYNVHVYVHVCVWVVFLPSCCTFMYVCT